MSRIWSNSDAEFRKAIEADDGAERTPSRYVLVIVDGSCQGITDKERHGFAIYKRRKLSVSALRHYEQKGMFTVKELDKRELIEELTGLEAESNGEN